MRNYRIYYLDNMREVTKDVIADDMFQLILKLDAEVLYSNQFLSIYKIKQIDL